MAKAKTYKVKALVNIKYDKTIVAAGKDFKVEKDDVRDLVEKGYIELLEEIKDDNNTDQDKDENGDDSGEEGEE